jgi:hypothetical protein
VAEEGDDDEVALPIASSSGSFAANKSRTLLKLKEVPSVDTLLGVRPYELSCLEVPQVIGMNEW